MGDGKRMGREPTVDKFLRGQMMKSRTISFAMYQSSPAACLTSRLLNNDFAREEIAC